MISNYKARINALQNIQEAIDELSGIVSGSLLINGSILLLNESRENIIEEMSEK